MGVTAAQLTGLRKLVVQPEQGRQWRLTEPTLLQLTALTALEHLQMWSGVPRPIHLKKKVSAFCPCLDNPAGGGGKHAVLCVLGLLAYIPAGRSCMLYLNNSRAASRCQTSQTVFICFAGALVQPP